MVDKHTMTLRHVDQKLEDLCVTERKLLQQLADIRTSRNQLHIQAANIKDVNRDSAAASLPAEIIAAIFTTTKILLDEIHDTSPFGSESMLLIRSFLALSQVSQRWRSIAIDTRSFWGAYTLAILLTAIQKSHQCFFVDRRISSSISPSNVTSIAARQS